jgi:nucleotide-binding universal stress UspA family protein
MTNDIHSSEQDNIPFTGTRRGDGGTYLIIADGSDEFEVAARYAARTVLARRSALAIAHITELDDFVHWGKVEAMMRHDLRQQAEKEIWHIAKAINETHEIYPSLYIREGKKIDKIIEIIEEDKSIRALVLAGSNNSSNQGPLVSYFTGKGMSRLRIPVIIVPGHLDDYAIDAVT